ncbi:phytoene/squalene synthase family protein [Corynebacterium aquatimens]|nr:phytoene/squalene synthase family protein [Corynebacterium aquatimens]
MSESAAAAVINEYSTSFSLATALLPKGVRRDIRNVYAVVRIADEVVDGTSDAAGVDNVEDVLNNYEAAIVAAPESRFHTDPIIHAYATTARRCKLEREHIQAFFASMRRDLDPTDHDEHSFDCYVYGSAEVIGLMCLNVFFAGEVVPNSDRSTLEAGARALGAAFQKVNFLRDLGDDHSRLGRRYFPQLNHRDLNDEMKAEIVSDIRRDLRVARTAMPLLPRRVRVGVVAAAALFEELTDMIESTPAHTLASTRIRVPAHRKAAITARSLVDAARMEQHP